MAGDSKRQQWSWWQWTGISSLAAVVLLFGLNAVVAGVARWSGLLHDAPEFDRTALTTTPLLMLSWGISILLMGAGLFLLLRGRENRPATALALALIGIGATNGPSEPWLPVAALTLVQAIGAATISYFWIIFCLEISGTKPETWKARSIRGAALLFAIVAFATSALITSGMASNATAILISFNTANQLVGYWILLSSYRQNDGTGRNRIKIALFAFIMLLLGNVTSILASSAFSGAYSILLEALGRLAFLFAITLLLHAVLKRRLFDFGFALNRTLVYATVSFVVLAAFGGAKWVIEHLIPESWHAGSEYYSFAIALGLFLVLHRVHTWVERNVERMFFGAWHRNDAALRRFVDAAGHFEQSGELCRAFAAELRRFAGGAGAAIYRRDRNGAYVLQDGSLDGAKPHVSPDDLALVLMRAERRAILLGGAQTALPGALALPMLDHGALSGFALLDGKADGSDYRPDEVEALGHAAQQVGLDLQTMHVAELEAEIAGLGASLVALTAQAGAARTRRKPSSRSGAAA